MGFSKIALFTGLVGALLIVISILLYCETGGEFLPFYDYGIVIDSGSSHSEIELYQWSADRKVKEKGSCSSSRAINSFGNNITGAVNSVLPCVVKLANEIDHSEHQVPVVLGATAGMRLLNETNSTLSNEILNAIDVAFKQIKPKNVKLLVEKPKIISGVNEGLYAWISSNYMMKIIPAKESEKFSPLNQTVGTLDMGGASVQVAFAADKAEANSEVKLFHKTYDVYSESLLCFGGDQALLRYLTILINEQYNQLYSPKVFQDPCANNGLMRKFTGKELQTVCTKFIPNTINFVNPEETYTFAGVFDEKTCKIMNERLTSIEQCKKQFSLCPKRNEVKPYLFENFLAMSNFYHSTRVINELRNQTKITYQKFHSNVNKFCSISWSAIEKETENICQSSVKYCRNYCFLLNFFDKVLFNLFNFNEENFGNIHFVNKISNETVGWSLGDMLVLSNNAPGIMPTKPIIPLWACVLIVILGIILLIFGLYNCYQKRDAINNVYQNF